jgi:uncharacterized protein YwgA
MRKIFMSGVLLLSCACLLSGCDTANSTPVENSIEYSNFNLIVDEKTKIVYIDNAIDTGANYLYTYHVYTPYYSENGYLCKFDDGKIIEIIPEINKKEDTE